MNKLFGWTEHAIVGAAATLVGAGLLHTNASANFLYVLLAAVLHELGDGDLITAPDAPWNGVKDTVAFMVVPSMLLIYDLLR